ncbi:unnamed protein product [Rhizophagus irregularis]|uniref:Uncharacterized protein n=1 Tax=Rhizophagus irregularis TaxID=588596 RepID=A0A915Z8W0_9GLOM|nr:unnamed protein product [Rhizophagus irregularis]
MMIGHWTHSVDYWMMNFYLIFFFFFGLQKEISSNECSYIKNLSSDGDTKFAIMVSCDNRILITAAVQFASITDLFFTFFTCPFTSLLLPRPFSSFCSFIRPSSTLSFHVFKTALLFQRTVTSFPFFRRLTLKTCGKFDVRSFFG